jgi:dTDP-3-amino-3,4,6-trideoxy-alpha-D-glucose transaminase
MPSLIPFNDLRRQWAATREEMTAAFQAVGESGRYILGAEVRAFEGELARFWGHSHAVGVASGLDAIEIALRIAGCRNGDKVLTTSNSAFATTLAIVRIGAIPVFADVDDFGLVDLEACESILSADPDIRFFVPVHLYGHSLDLARLRALKDRHQLVIVEDCAQSIGAKWRGEATGSVGQLAANSFYPTKNLGALGDGGAILTSVPEFAEAARKYRDYGQSAKYRHELVGGNSRLDELQAALLRRVGLPHLAEWTAPSPFAGGPLYRRDRQSPHCGSRSPGRFRIGVALVPGAGRAGNQAGLPQSLEDSWHRSVRALSSSDGRPAGDGDARHNTPAKLLRVRRFCGSEVSLPLYPFLTDDECDRVIDACCNWQ